jgi:hypothetical protein
VLSAADASPQAELPATDTQQHELALSFLAAVVGETAHADVDGTSDRAAGEADSFEFEEDAAPFEQVLYCIPSVAAPCAWFLASHVAPPG